MALDPAANFVRGSTTSSIDGSSTTLNVSDASIYPDPASEGAYNVVVWAADSFPRPDQDPDVEIMRVTGVDTTNDTLSVSRGEEGTVGASHPSGSAVQLSPTAKMFSDIASRYTAAGEDFDGQGSSSFQNLAEVSTDRLATDYLYARSFDGADADARLSNALSAVSAGQTIYLEPATYTASASISTSGVRLIGSGGRAQTSVDANWTVDTPNVDINEVTWLSQSSGDVLTVNGIQLRMVGCDSTGNIQVANDDCIILGLSGGSVTFASGTGGGVVDGSTGVSVTDDGTNTVGTIG